MTTHNLTVFVSKQLAVITALLDEIYLVSQSAKDAVCGV